MIINPSSVFPLPCSKNLAEKSNVENNGLGRCNVARSRSTSYVVRKSMTWRKKKSGCGYHAGAPFSWQSRRGKNACSFMYNMAKKGRKDTTIGTLGCHYCKTSHATTAQRKNAPFPHLLGPLTFSWYTHQSSPLSWPLLNLLKLFHMYIVQKSGKTLASNLNLYFSHVICRLLCCESFL